MQIKNAKQKGITLIALVVTIVVLLILAGVSISMLKGDNGLITSTQTAKGETEKAEIREQIQVAVINSCRKNAEVNTQDLAKELSQISNIKYNNNKITSTTVISLPAIIQYKNNVGFKITKDGEIEEVTI